MLRAGIDSGQLVGRLAGFRAVGVGRSASGGVHQPRAKRLEGTDWYSTMTAVRGIDEKVAETVQQAIDRAQRDTGSSATQPGGNLNGFLCDDEQITTRTLLHLTHVAQRQAATFRRFRHARYKG